MAYTEKDTIDMLEEAINSFEFLYNSDVINYSGKTSDKDKYYSEVCAEQLLKKLNNNNNIFGEIIPIRDKIYFQEDHLNGKVKINLENPREETTVKRIVFGNFNLGELGMPVDFQVPLNQQQDGGRGKIDLLTFNKEKNCFYIVETKSIKSREQALRAILEIATYRKMIDLERIKTEYPRVLRDYYNFELIKNVEISLKTAILLFKGSNPADQIMADDNLGEKLRALAQKLEVQVFILPPPELPIRIKLEDEIEGNYLI
ncbi:MAG: hypothetical protein M0Q48_10715 [Verrucomicrobia bacterium]|nr:hypothetical protein [Verrucomicrobiota bacterium]